MISYETQDLSLFTFAVPAFTGCGAGTSLSAFSALLRPRALANAYPGAYPGPHAHPRYRTP